MYRATSPYMVQGNNKAAGKKWHKPEQMTVMKMPWPRALSPAQQERAPVVRSDFEETGSPHLVPDSTGYVPVAFRTNGLLSTFRILVLAHTSNGGGIPADEILTVKKK